MAQDQIRGILVILVHLGENQEKKEQYFLSESKGMNSLRKTLTSLIVLSCLWVHPIGQILAIPL